MAMNTPRKKLIEVALPLEAINREAAREKSIRHGHPSTLHLWWARRPLAAARAVIFAQMVDDPGSVPEEFPTVEAQEEERQRLFRLIEELVLWENTTNEDVLNRARAEIKRSWARECLGAPASRRLSNDEISAMLRAGKMPALPAFHDPFAGGGALPLEAQRLGLEAHASDLNPVAVMINKAMIEIPPRFAGRPPINPEARGKYLGALASRRHAGEESRPEAGGPRAAETAAIPGFWRGAAGLAEDVRYYGQWMRDEAEKRIGHLYPKAKVTAEMAKDRLDLKPYVGRELTVIAWLWARTVESSNPAYRGCDVPLISSFWLSTKAGKETWIEPVVDGKTYRFEVRTPGIAGVSPAEKARIDAGTKLGRGANFRCVLSQSPLSPDYIKAEGIAGRMGARLMAVVAEGDRGRFYLPPIADHEVIARLAKPKWEPEQALPNDPRNFWTVSYGLKKYADLYTPRQLVALTTFSDVVAEARARVEEDAAKAALPEDKNPLRDGGTGSRAYAEAVSVYLAFAVDKSSQRNNTLCTWEAPMGRLGGAFGRQAIPMTWDYAETNPLAGAGGDLFGTVVSACEAIVKFPSVRVAGHAAQQDARLGPRQGAVVSTDPPYYDNIGYADLSDFFYVWMRNSLQTLFPDLFSTVLVPKADELVATPYRHGSKDAAEAYFLDGMTKALNAMAARSDEAFPVTIYYAFKQSEGDSAGVASTGWETFLDATLRAGFSLTGTWPMRTELTVALKKTVSVLASSIVLVCRPRPADAPQATRKDFLAALRRELPPALRHLQEGNIAPVDLAQASIGPGMGVFSRYSKILETDGKPMTVRTALQMINQTLDEVLAEQEGDFDPETAWAVAWFEQFGFNDGPFGDAETLSKAKNTALNALVEAGIVKAGSGKARLLRVDELSADWDPTTDKRLTVWEMVHHLIRVMNSGGESGAADLVAKLGGVADTARELAYRLYSVCERRKRAAEALAYNALVQSWPEITRLARESTSRPQAAVQGELL